MTAVAEGDFDLMSEGKLKLSYLPRDSVILNDDLVLTSGVGGMYPNKLVIGRVEEVKPSTSGADSYAVIVPSADLAGLKQIFVVIDFDISE